MPDGALEGLKLIELGQMVSAPYCARLFAHYGADVIKVEPPDGGDITRRWGPFPQDHRWRCPRNATASSSRSR